MIHLGNLTPKIGARHRRRRLGFGEGSGHGQTSTKGQKGQRSRSGDGKMPGFEGGQNPVLRRVPKRGFSNRAFKKTFRLVQVSDIERVFKNQKEVSLEALRIHGLASARDRVKVLGTGSLSQPYRVSAHAFSASAREKIKAAGGEAVSVAS
ncbi:MAG TPA: 50S ribosomal protein L15 [Elusimicrobiota bacterium]|nr:50S ribosomal protein L15 [Elusimicrobiota bacterium]